ncbi:hypothetical protein DENSPDRAFT_844875 [Dentipellis sp. KUC8613]|nr:hypothetical protein DENSPDRAFT_844875 [Dentipellis sp. KUC8613]
MSTAPPEIWLTIFEHATFVPHAFDADAGDPFDVAGAPLPHDGTIQKDLIASLSTKWSLALVCKSWHELATPLLYQAVAAGSDKSLQSLCDALARFASADLPIRRPRVRRLDLFRWSPFVLSSKQASANLISIFTYLPDLEIICGHSFPSELADLNSYMQALVVNCGHSLRKCSLYSPFISRDDCVALLTRCPRLAHLYILRHPRPRKQSYSLQDIPKQNNLTFLSLDLPLSQHQEPLHPIPSLQHVHILLQNPPYLGVEDFLSVQGPHLRTIQLNAQRFSTQENIQVYFDFFGEYCPKLVHLIIICESWSQLFPPVSLPPTVTHLGVFATGECASNGLAEYLERTGNLANQRTIPVVIKWLNSSTKGDLERPLIDVAPRALPTASSPQCRLKDADGSGLSSS